MRLLQAVIEQKKMIRVQPFQPLAHNFEEIDDLNSYCNNLKNVLH